MIRKGGNRFFRKDHAQNLRPFALSAHALQHIDPDGRRYARPLACSGAPSLVDLADQRRDGLAVSAGDGDQGIPKIVLKRDGCAMPRDGERALVAWFGHFWLASWPHGSRRRLRPLLTMRRRALILRRAEGPSRRMRR